MFDIPGEPPRKAAAARLESLKKLPGGVTWFRYAVAGKPRGERRRAHFASRNSFPGTA